MPDITLDLISTSQACSLLGNIEKATLTNWVRQGRILAAHKGSKKNSAYLFDRGYVERFAADLRILAAAPPANTLPGLEAEPTSASAQ
jgi:hypothetical protein